MSDKSPEEMSEAAADARTGVRPITLRERRSSSACTAAPKTSRTAVSAFGEDARTSDLF